MKNRTHCSSGKIKAKAKDITLKFYNENVRAKWHGRNFFIQLKQHIVAQS